MPAHSSEPQRSAISVGTDDVGLHGVTVPKMGSLPVLAAVGERDRRALHRGQLGANEASDLNRIGPALRESGC